MVPWGLVYWFVFVCVLGTGSGIVALSLLTPCAVTAALQQAADLHHIQHLLVFALRHTFSVALPTVAPVLGIKIALQKVYMD